MKKRLFALCAIVAAAALTASAAAPVYTDAQNLTHTGKLFATSNPYHRVEVAEWPQMTEQENKLLRYAAGEAVLFETDATEIWVKASFGDYSYARCTPRNGCVGFNLYIERDGKWLWAASNSNKVGVDDKGAKNLDKPLKLIANMSGEMHKCLLYLPPYAELFSMEVGVNEGATIKPLANPFRHKIVIFGSSFTHGAATTNAGQTYPGFLQRQTGLDFYSVAMDGNSKLQRFMGEIMASTDADAFFVDAFSNPTPEQIGERMFPFLDAIRAKHPKTPIIFMQTLYRESRNFDTKRDEYELKKRDCVEKLMQEVAALYNDVYFINIENTTGTDHETSADGTHPSSWGYKRVADAIQPALVEILAKYGIR